MRVQGGTASVSEVRGEGNTRLLRSLGVENRMWFPRSDRDRNEKMEAEDTV